MTKPEKLASLEYGSRPRSKKTIFTALGLLFPLSAWLLFLYWRLRLGFMPIYRGYFDTYHNLTYFDLDYSRFLDSWTPIYYSLTFVGLTCSTISLCMRRHRSLLVLGVNLLTLAALITFSVTARDYP